MFSEFAYEIWLDLKDRFQQSNGSRIFQLRLELINHNQKQNSVAIYFMKLKALWEELNKFQAQLYLWKMYMWRTQGAKYIFTNGICHVISHGIK